MPSVKIAISLPQDIFKWTTQAAKKAGVSRSEFIRRALDRRLSREGSAAMTARVNKHLDEHPLTEDEVDSVRASGADVARMLKGVDW